MSQGNKKLSGSQNLKRKKQKVAENEKSAKQLAKFVKVIDRSHTLVGANTDNSPTPADEDVSITDLAIPTSSTSSVAVAPVAGKDKLSNSNDDSFSQHHGDSYESVPGPSSWQTGMTPQSALPLNVSEDIAKWPNPLPNRVVDEIVLRGPNNNNGKLDNEEDYPRNEKGRHFSNKHFQRIMPNGEKYARKWLVYSKSSSKVFCLYCYLFRRNSISSLANEGYDDWAHISLALQKHETSKDHQSATCMWLEATKRLGRQTGVDQHLMKQIDEERQKWKAILERMMAITLFLAENNLAFRGRSDTLNTPHNGNFLGLVQLLGKFDPVMIEHLRSVANQETKNYYFSKNIQNELIELLGNEVRDTIIMKIKRSKYFSIILDCTPDISHTEQLSVTFRFFDIDDNYIRECFVTYTPVSESSGQGLTGLFLDEVIKKHDLDMHDCRGQGYDNGANMVGNQRGVQSCITREFPRAFFNPCGCHSLNLVVSDAAKTSVKSVSLFGVIQRLFVFFSSSTKRWEVISKHTEALTLKKVCETRWESRVSSLQAVRYQYTEVRDALQEQYEESTDPVAASEARSLAQHMDQYEFLLILVIWYDLLYQINIVSKSLQSESTDLLNATNLLHKCCQFVKEYRDTGYASAVIIAKEIAEKAEISPVFQQTRNRRRKRMFDYESQDETPIDSEQNFKTTVFYPLIDTIVNSLEIRFQQMSNFNASWCFLYDLKRPVDKPELEQSCLNLQNILTHDSHSDISGADLAQEILSLKHFLDADQGQPKDVLNVLNKNDWCDLFPNTWTALRILQTIPVSVAKGERSFSKLKLIKTYLRSTIAQEKMSNLAILSIENDIAQSIPKNNLIVKFASAKARKVNFV